MESVEDTIFDTLKYIDKESLEASEFRPFNGWYTREMDVATNLGSVCFTSVNEKEGKAYVEGPIILPYFPVNRIFNKARVSALFWPLPDNIHSLYAIFRVIGTEEKNVVKIGDRKYISASTFDESSLGLFFAELPIKSVEQSNDFCTIVASGVYNGERIGFKIEIPNQFAPIIIGMKDDKLVYNDSAKVTNDINVKCNFLSTKKETVNFFNCLNVGNFKKIKKKIEFDFCPLIGYVSTIPSSLKNDDDKSIVSHAEDVLDALTNTLVKENENTDVVRIKLSLNMHDRIYINEDGEECVEIFQLLIEISPSKKVIRVMEKDTSDRHNLKYIFMDYEKKNGKK